MNNNNDETIHDNLQEFPTLMSLSLKVENATYHHDKQADEIRNSDRYNDNEAERSYLLNELDENLRAELSQADEDWAVELAAIQRDLSDRAFGTNVGTEDERQAASQLIDTVKSQLVTTPDVVDTIEMLATKTLYMSDAEKVAVASQLDSLQEAALNKATGSEETANINNEFKQMRRNVADVKVFKDSIAQRKEIKRIAGNRPPGVAAKRLREIAKQASGKGLV